MRMPTHTPTISMHMDRSVYNSVTFETWVDTLIGRDKVCTDMSGIIWTLS